MIFLVVSQEELAYGVIVTFGGGLTVPQVSLRSNQKREQNCQMPKYMPVSISLDCDISLIFEVIV